jgi:hypothetical protein
VCVGIVKVWVGLFDAVGISKLRHNIAEAIADEVSCV